MVDLLAFGDCAFELIAEYNAAGTLLKRYVHGVGSDDPLVSYDGSGTTSPTYLLADERGSIMAETSSVGTVTTKHQYGPYGEPINQSASRFRYTGQILLPGTELYHYKARVYHPKLGRFLQTDPIGYKDGMNWYAYVGNDPMNAVDPDGTEQKKAGVGTRIQGKVSVNSSEYGVGSNLIKPASSQSIADRVANEATERGYIKGKGEADWIYQNNTNSNLTVTVKAHLLTAKITGKWVKAENGGFKATARIVGEQYEVHGQGTVRLRPNGTYGFFDGDYDYEMHSVESLKDVVRNISTYLGEPSSSGWSNTPFKIHYEGNINVEF